LHERGPSSCNQCHSSFSASSCLACLLFYSLWQGQLRRRSLFWHLIDICCRQDSLSQRCVQEKQSKLEGEGKILCVKVFACSAIFWSNWCSLS